MKLLLYSKKTLVLGAFYWLLNDFMILNDSIWFWKKTLNIPSLSHLRQNILLRNYSNWSKQGCLRVILEFLSLVHMKPGHFCGGEGVKVQFHVLAEGRQEAAHNKKLFAPPFFPQPALIKTPPFLPLYSLNFSKTRKLFQSIFLLFYLNQSFV